MPRKTIVPQPRRPCTSSPNRLSYHQYEPEPVIQKPTKTGMAMSVEQMADELAIGRNVAYQLIRQPGFPAFMIGRRVLISRKGLQTWIDEQCKRGSFIPALEEENSHQTIEK